MFKCAHVIKINYYFFQIYFMVISKEAEENRPRKPVNTYLMFVHKKMAGMD